MSVPNGLCEAATYRWHERIRDLGKGVLRALQWRSTVTIFTFVTTLERLPQTMIYLQRPELRAIQIGLRMFISQYSAEYGLIVTRLGCGAYPVLIVFLLVARRAASKASLPRPQGLIFCSFRPVVRTRSPLRKSTPHSRLVRTGQA